jgi:hypothetical protein
VGVDKYQSRATFTLSQSSLVPHLETFCVWQVHQSFILYYILKPKGYKYNSSSQERHYCISIGVIVAHK